MSKVFIRKEQLKGCERWELGSLGATSERAREREPGPDPTEATREAARKEGYTQGYAAGAEQARAEAQRLRAIVDAYAEGLAQLEEAVADEVLDLAIDVARQVLRTAPKVQRDALLTTVREALGFLPLSVAHPKLVLNPSDAELVRAQLGDELAAAGVRIVEDQRIECGGCRVGAPSCDVDATLATRWRRVLATLGKDDAWVEG